MAVSPESSIAFQREVDEELRREQVANAWRRYGIWMVGAVVVALAIYAGVLWRQHHRADTAGRQGETLQQAFDALGSGKLAEANAPLQQLAGSGSDGYRALAMFTQADLLLQKKDLNGAAAIFGKVAGDETVAQPFRDLALIRQTTAQFDTLKPRWWSTV